MEDEDEVIVFSGRQASGRSFKSPPAPRLAIPSIVKSVKPVLPSVPVQPSSPAVWSGPNAPTNQALNPLFANLMSIAPQADIHFAPTVHLQPAPAKWRPAPVPVSPSPLETLQRRVSNEMNFMGAAFYNSAPAAAPQIPPAPQQLSFNNAFNAIVGGGPTSAGAAMFNNPFYQQAQQQPPTPQSRPPFGMLALVEILH
jgi:hypothetical protein